MLGTIYLICFLVGLGLALLRGALAMFGADTHADIHVDTEVGTDADGDSPGGGLINLTVISTFVTVFGGVGALMHYTFKSGAGVSLAVAAVGGLALALMIGLIIRKIVTSTQAGSEPVKITGLPAEVITPIPAGGLGEVAYVAKGTRFAAPARAKDGGAIEKSAAVTIVETAGATCVVEKK